MPLARPSTPALWVVAICVIAYLPAGLLLSAPSLWRRFPELPFISLFLLLQALHIGLLVFAIRRFGEGVRWAFWLTLPMMIVIAATWLGLLLSAACALPGSFCWS